MKTSMLKQIVCLLLCTTFLFSACKKDDEPITPDIPNQMTFKFDGADFEVFNVLGAVTFDGLILLGEMTDEADPESIVIVLPTDVQTGTYDLVTGSGEYTARYHFDALNILYSSSGKVMITEHNVEEKFIEGTFNFEASALTNSDISNFTDGFFSLTYE